MNENIVGTQPLDDRLARSMVVDWEKVAWAALVVIAVLTRLWALGDRAMSHDESLHTYYSWRLWHGEGYRHDPMMHGPFLYHATALSYFLFGVNDFTARLLGVFTGIALVLSPLLVRRWMGVGGALFAGLFLTLSPTVMYYSRYIRHDIPVELFTVLMFVAFIRYIDSRSGRWIVVALAAAAAAITSAEMAYINGFVLALFVGLALASERLGTRGGGRLALALAGGGLGLLAFALVAQSGRLGDVADGSNLRFPMQVGLMLGGVGVIYGIAISLLSSFRNDAAENETQGEGSTLSGFMADRYFERFGGSSSALTVFGAGALLLVGGALLGRWLPSVLGTGGVEGAAASLASGRFTVLAGIVPPLVLSVGGALLVFGLGGLLWRAFGNRVNLVILGLGAAIAAVGAFLAMQIHTGALFGSLTGMQSVYIAVLGAVIAAYGFLGWCLEDHGSRRLTAAIGQADGRAIAGALAVFAVIYALLFTTFFTEPDKISGFVDSLRYWWEQHDVQRGGQPWYYYLLFVPMYEFAPLLLALAGSVVYVLRSSLRVGQGNDGTLENPSAAAKLFVPMMMAWAAANLWIYSWAGEKMPWLIVHLVVPVALLAGRVMGDLLSAVDWTLVRRGGWKVAGLALVLMVTFGAWTFGSGSAGADRMAGAVVGLAVVLVVAWALWRAAMETGGRQARLVVAFAAAVGLVVLNTRYALMANFVNDELANEYIVYAHGTPDDKLVYDTLRDMQMRFGAENPLKLGYDNEVSWPFTWYFRNTDWYNAEYLAENPSSVRDHDVVLIGDPNYDKFHPYLRDRYKWVDYRRMWWPNEGYKNLTPRTLLENVTDPNLRRNLIDIVLFRRYRTDPRDPASDDKPLTNWYHQANMRMYVKNDLIERLWPLAQNRPEWPTSGVSEPVVDVSAGDLSADLHITEADAKPIVSPKDVAVGPDGKIYIVDQGNSRVVVTDTDGKFLSAFGDADLRDAEGTSTAWGIGVGADGAVYVADTWQHRIVKFVNGRKAATWGTFGEHRANAQEEMLQFFGPRDIAVAADGTLWVTDTGNSRVVHFSADGKPIKGYGGDGVEPGQFREPVGIAIDPATGDFFVSDLWNFRVQRFDKDFNPLKQWVVDGWEDNEAADDKAYIAVGPGSTVVVSDPVGKRVSVYDAEGTLLATLDVIHDEEGLDKPIGVAIDPTGRILVTSHNRGVVTRYKALPAVAGAAELPAEGVAGEPEAGISPTPGVEGAAGDAAGVSPTPPPTPTGNDAGAPSSTSVAPLPPGFTQGASPSPTQLPSPSP